MAVQLTKHPVPTFRMYETRNIGIWLGGILALWCMLPAIASAAIIKPANNLGLIGYWNLDEKVGTTAYDHGSGANNGTLTSSPSWTTGRYGQALTFGSSNNYVSTSLGLPMSAGTISFWTYPTSYSDWIALGGWKQLGNGQGYILLDEGGSGSPGRWRAIFNLNYSNSPGEAAVVALQSINQNTWQHVVETWSLSGSTYTIHLYVNGVDQGSATWTGTVGSSFSTFSIGRGGAYNDNYYKGKIDDVRVYNRALSVTEVSALYRGTAGTRYGSSLVGAGSTLQNGLLAQWTFDGADVTDKVYDRVGGYNGYVVGIATSSAKTSGKLGQALSFNGSTNWVSVSNAPVVSSYPYTLTGWAKLNTSTSNGSLISLARTSSNGDYQGVYFNSADGYWHFTRRKTGENGNQPIDITGGSASVGQWQFFVAIARSATDMEFYINGHSVGTNATSVTFDTLTDNTTIGVLYRNNAPTTNPFNGSIDDVRIYNRALSASEVAQLYAQGGAKLNSSSASLQNGSSLASGLVGLWTFDGKDVTDKVYDRSGRGNNGYFYAAATSSAKAAGVLGQALRFNGATYVSVPYSSSLNTTSAVTISGWLKTTQATRNDFIERYSTSSPYPGFGLVMVPNYTCGSTAGQVGFWVGDNTSKYLCSSASYNDGKWHFFTGVYDGATAYLYVDGALVASGARTNGLNQTSQALRIGGAVNGSNFLNGSMDEVRIYNRALSASEVQQLYKLGR